MKTDEDISWMLKVKKDDLDAFEKLYKRYAKVIGNFYLRLGCTMETSQDYVQEVFMRIWRSRKNYEPRAKFTTFLFQVAKNFWINEYDKIKKRPGTHSLEDQNTVLDNTIDGEKTPGKSALTAELNGQIHDAIQELGEKYRLVFVLSHLEGLKYKEIAEILEIPVGTVKSRMANAEKVLREKLEKYVTDDQ